MTTTLAPPTQGAFEPSVAALVAAAMLIAPTAGGEPARGVPCESYLPAYALFFDRGLRSVLDWTALGRSRLVVFHPPIAGDGLAGGG